VLTALLRRQLADLAARGEVVASLRASEAVIYERFGYGIATWAADYELDRRRGPLRDTLGGSGPVRLAGQGESFKPLADIYRAAAWTGSIDRPQHWWNLRQLLAEAAPGPGYLAVHGTEGAEDGYVSSPAARWTTRCRSCSPTRVPSG
jgi:predicted acetyltransferase